MLFLKLSLIVVYLVGIAAWFTPVLGSAGIYFSYATLALWVAHALEIFYALPFLKRHPGGLTQSLLLCVLFGFIHWLPLKKQGAPAQN